MIQDKILFGTLHEDHLGSPEVPTPSSVFAHNAWLKKLGAWAWSHCIYLVTTHWCNCTQCAFALHTWVIMQIAHLGHHLNLGWGQMLAWPFKAIVHIFRNGSTREIRKSLNYVISCLSPKVICEKQFLPKKAILIFCDLWDLTIKLYPKTARIYILNMLKS